MSHVKAIYIYTYIYIYIYIYMVFFVCLYTITMSSW